MRTLKQKMSAQNAAINGKPTVISIFAGCGGSSLGYKQAGFKELLAIDFDRNAVEIFRLNFKDTPIWQRDIKEITVKEIVDFCNIKKGSLDVLDGSPPCQGFSTAGKRKVMDERNDLFKEYIRLIEGLQPKVFVMENVSGMVKGKMKGKFIEIMKLLKAIGYNVKCKLMNTMYYQVPQSRQRLIWIGTRNDLGRLPEFPKPQTSRPITVSQAFKDIDGTKNHNPKPLNKNIKSYRNWFKARGTRIPVLGQSIYRLELHRPSFTIKSSSEMFHPTEPRRLTTREYLRLFSFPDDYQIKLNSHVKIGNSVPPKFMEAIAKNIKENILQ